MRHSIRFRIFFAVAVIPMFLTLAAIYILSSVSERQVRSRIESEMQASGRVLGSLLEVHTYKLRSGSEVVASASGLKAALSTGDPRTVKDVLREEVSLPSTWDAVQVRNRSGALLANLERRDGRIVEAADTSSVEVPPDPRGVPLVAWGPHLAWVHRAPIVIQEEEIGSILVAEWLDRELLLELGQSVNGEVVLVHDGIPTVTTLPAAAGEDLRRLSPPSAASLESPRIVRLRGERFVSIFLPPGTDGGAASSANGFVLLRSLDQATASLLAPLRRSLLAIGALAVLAALGVSYILSRGITGSLTRLVEATREIRAGTYDRPVRVESRDEIGLLAANFEQMREALRSHLDLLDRRYREILETQAKLTETQSQLVQSEKLAAMGKLTAQISHELNNPIHNIRSIMELLLTKVPESDPRREFVTLVALEADRMSDLTRRLLDFYRPASETMVPLSIHDVLKETLAVSDSNLAGQGVRVEMDLDPSSPIVEGSANQLKQVFLNLLVNASDAMPGGGCVSIRSRVANGGVRLQFQDTGCGIAPENIDKVFDAFFTTKSQASGVGLGLSVSYGIVQRHRGTIRVESLPGKGAVFTVWFPLATAVLATEGRRTPTDARGRR